LRVCDSASQLIRQSGLNWPVVNFIEGISLSLRDGPRVDQFRQQLIVLQRHVKRPALTWRDRALFVLIARKLPT